MIEDRLMSLAFKFSEIVGKNSYTFVNSKMEVIQNEKSIAELHLAYKEIINSLLSDKEQLITIAREYKYELERVEISDKDIEHLHSTMYQAVTILNKFSPTKDKNKDIVNSIIEHFSKDTLKTMQLLGFNYKEAIGVPLTEVSPSFIKSKLGSFSKDKSGNR